MNNKTMNSQETLWFIGKCLSLAVHPERAGDVEKELESGRINWNSLVYHSSNQLVLPAFYLNLKRTNLLSSLPKDLLDHLEDITNRNRDRNQKILSQVDKITNILRSNGLEPIFLKGIAHIVDGLYEDIAERMLSDIDLLLEKKDALKAWHLLKDSGYSHNVEFEDYNINVFRHLPELTKKNEISSIEIHTRVLEGNHNNNFNFYHIQSEIQKSPYYNVFVPSTQHQILHNVLNAQYNENAYMMHLILLRNNYDLLLLANQLSPLEIICEFGYNFPKLNTYLGLSANILDFPKKLEFNNARGLDSYVRIIKLSYKYPSTANIIRKIGFIIFRLYRYFNQFVLFFIKSSVRNRIIKSLSYSDYYRAHLSMYKKWFS